MSEEKSYARVLAERAIQNHVQNLIEQSNNDYDSNEYDYEGDMAMSQLKSIITNAQRLHDMLEENTNLPEWVQSKITLAEDYILTAANYMEGEMNEEVEQVDEVSIKTLAAAAAASRDSSKFVSHAKKRYGEKVAADVQNAADIADDRLKKKTSGGLDLLSQRIPVRTTQTGEANKQDLAKRKRELKQDALYRKPVKPMASEEVEQMNTDENESNILKNIRTAKTVLGLKGLNISAAEKAHSQLATHGNIAKISPNLRGHYLQLSNAVPSDTLHLPPEQFRSVLARLKQVQERGLSEENVTKEVEQVDEKYMGFKAVEKAVAAKGARNPAAVAAAIGRKKYGKEKFQAMAAAGKRAANEEVEQVTEAEGTVAVTPREKDLAAYHGDPKKITYGDVIKARLKSAAAKKMDK